MLVCALVNNCALVAGVRRNHSDGGTGVHSDRDRSGHGRTVTIAPLSTFVPDHGRAQQVKVLLSHECYLTSLPCSRNHADSPFSRAAIASASVSGLLSSKASPPYSSALATNPNISWSPISTCP